MSPSLLFVAFVAVGLGFVQPAQGQEKPDDPRSKTEQNIARIQQILTETRIDTMGWPSEMSLSVFLKTLQASLPRNKQITLRLDEKAFGKDLAKVASAPTYFHPRTMSLRRAIHEALNYVPHGIEADYAIDADGVTITRPRLAAHIMIHSIHGLAEEMPLLLPSLNKADGNYEDLNPKDGLALLVRYLANSVELRPWETIRLLNGSRVETFASPRNQVEIAGFLAGVRRSSDLAVVMNARLYEVDRPFFLKHVVPLLAADKEPEDRAIVTLDGPLFKLLSRQKLLLESEDIHIRPTRNQPFLSQQSVVRYSTGPMPGAGRPAPVGTALAAVSFEVRPIVSGDRRYMRLRITQHASQLVGIGKASALNPATGKEVEVEVPNIRRTSVSGTIQIADGAPILMPVRYRPPGKEHENKVWLLVARPWIRIQEEVEILQKSGEDTSSKAVWNKKVEKELEPPPAKPLPFNEEVKQILQAIVTDVLTNPGLKHTREFYGTPKDKTLILHDNEMLGWPKEFRPDTHGHKLVEEKKNPFVDRRRILAIRIDKFDLKQKKTTLFDTPIEVCVFNGGGNANGGVIGGCSLYYTAKRAGKRWTVNLDYLRDP